MEDEFVYVVIDEVEGERNGWRRLTVVGVYEDFVTAAEHANIVLEHRGSKFLIRPARVGISPDRYDVAYTGIDVDKDGKDDIVHGLTMIIKQRMFRKGQEDA